MFYEQRSFQNERVDTVRIPLEGGITQEEIDALKTDGYTEVLEHYIVLYKPPEVEVLKDKLEQIAEALPDELAAKHPEIYPELTQSGEAVPADYRIRWGDQVAKAKVALWDREDQDPDHAPELWDILAFGESGYREIPEVITAELAFGEGEIGYWPADGKHYRAKRDGVVHNPEVYPGDWEVVP